MALNIILTKQGRSLVAQDSAAIEGLERVKNGQQVRAVVTVPRNVRHHRLFFALLNLVIKGQAEPVTYLTSESLLDAIKIATGHTREIIQFDGSRHFVPKSIDFASMDDVEFRAFFDAAIGLVLRHILPHCNRPDLEREIYHALGEPAPDDFRY